MGCKAEPPRAFYDDSPMKPAKEVILCHSHLSLFLCSRAPAQLFEIGCYSSTPELYGFIRPSWICVILIKVLKKPTTYEFHQRHRVTRKHE